MIILKKGWRGPVSGKGGLKLLSVRRDAHDTRPRYEVRPRYDRDAHEMRPRYTQACVEGERPSVARASVESSSFERVDRRRDG
eukprot:2206794-Pleurochrysis_carterae.AAC.1